MTPVRHQREVENRLKDAVKHDRARVQIGRISRFGLLEMSRQRLRPSLGESATHVCPRCHGRGTIRSTESSALSILRLIEEESIKDNTSQIHAQVPVAVATYLMNEKREAVRRIETRHGIRVFVIPNEHLETPNHEVIRIRIDEEIDDVSYNMVKAPEATTTLYQPASDAVKEKPAISAINIADSSAPRPAPKAQQPEAQAQSTGLFKAISNWFGKLFGANETSEQPAAPKRQAERGNNRNNRDNKDGRADANRDNNRRRNNKRRRNDGEDRANLAQRDDNSVKQERAERPERTERAERPTRPQQDSRPARQEARKPVEKPADKVVVTKDQDDDAPQRVAERRQRRNARKSVRMEKAAEAQPQAAVVAELVVSPATDLKQEMPAAIASVDTAQNLAPVADTPVVDDAIANVAVPTDVTQNIDTNDTSDSAADTAEPRSRNRRSPRHLRAAGQKRKKEQTEAADNNDDAVVAANPVADEVVEEVVTATAPVEATQAATPVEVSANEQSVSEAETDVVADKPKTRSRRKPAKKADVAEPAVAATPAAEIAVVDSTDANANEAVETQATADVKNVEQAKPVVAEAEIVTKQATVVESVSAPAEQAAVKAATAAPAKSRFAQMVVATMTKPELPQTDDTTQAAAPVMPTEARPQVSSSERPAGSAFARQAASAPMTKPKSAE